MGNPTGFMEFPRVTAPYRPVAERIADYRDVATQLSASELQRQASRCMDCGIPFCHALGCPVYNLIPEWNDLVYRGRWREAWERLEMTNNFPEITGRVCPAPCEASCTLSINSAPVAIKQIELAIIERAFAEGWVVARPPASESGKRVAVIGSGPAGLSAAQQLRRRGHQVTVFERAERIGGILRYGIPDFKLEKGIIDRRLDQMRAEGVRFETSVVIGEDISIRYLRRTHDVIVLTLGAGAPRDLHVPGRGLEGIHFAMEYLTASNRVIAGDLAPEQAPSARGKRVLVIGGGDTGADCVGTAIRQGASRVQQFEIMPKPQVWDKPWNPSWPAWPQILRFSTSHEEGCERDWAVATLQFTGRDVRVEQAVCARVEWIKEGSKPFAPRQIPGSEFAVDAELVLIAMGFVHVEHSRLIESLGVNLDARGNIEMHGSYGTSVPDVFVAGDAHTGASLVVRAIYHGREAAKAVDQFLGGK